MEVDVRDELALVEAEDAAIEKQAQETLKASHRVALRLWVMGKTAKEIEELTGVTYVSLRYARSSAKGKEYLNQLEAEMDQDLRRLQVKANKVIDLALDSADMGVALAGVNLFAKMAGKFVHKIEKRDITAEDLVQKILSGELQVNRRRPITIDGVVVSRSLDDEEKDEDRRALTG